MLKLRLLVCLLLGSSVKCLCRNFLNTLSHNNSFFLSFLFYFDRVCITQAGLVLLCSQKWPWVSESLASGAECWDYRRVLAAKRGLCEPGNRTQGLCARPTLYQLSHVSSSGFGFVTHIFMTHMVIREVIPPHTHTFWNALQFIVWAQLSWLGKFRAVVSETLGSSSLPFCQLLVSRLLMDTNFTVVF